MSRRHVNGRIQTASIPGWARDEPKAKPPKTCGTCTLCCNLVAVAELDKPRDVWCKHRVPGACSIYADRPLSCRSWSCLWLVEAHMPMQLRPDRCHCVFDPYPDVIKTTDNETGVETKVQVCQLYVDARYPLAHRNPFVRAVIYSIADHQGCPTLARIGDLGVVIVAPPLSADGKWHERESQFDPEWGNRSPEARLREAGFS